jgi:hypothetical protein
MKALVAEMVGNFSKRLTEAYGINVRELTGVLRECDDELMLLAASCPHTPGAVNNENDRVTCL